MRENSPIFSHYEKASPTILSDGADVAFQLSHLGGAKEAHHLAEDARVMREKKRTQELLQTAQGHIGKISKTLVELRQEKASDTASQGHKDDFQGDYELAG